LYARKNIVMPLMQPNRSRWYREGLAVFTASQKLKDLVIDGVRDPFHMTVAKDEVRAGIMVGLEPLGHFPVIDKSFRGVAPIRSGGSPVDRNYGGGVGI